MMTNITFQRRGWRLGVWYLCEGFLWLMAAAVIAGFVIAWFPLNTWTGEKAFFIFLAGVLSIAAIRGARSVRARVRHFETYFVALEDHGVRLRLPSVGETCVAWNEIEGVTHQKRWIEARNLFWVYPYRLDTFTILTRRCPFAFTAMEVRRPKRAARAIAQRIGAEVQELAPVRERQIS